VAAVVAVGAVWAGAALTAQEPKPVDLTALRDAVARAGRRGENVDDIRAALDALEKAAPRLRAERVPPELQALRDAVDGAARKGEKVEAIAEALLAVETAVAGRSLARPKPEPTPNPGPFPDAPFGLQPDPGAGAIDIQMFDKAMEMRRKALEGIVQNARDPKAVTELQKQLAEANELMKKAVRGGGLARGLPGFGRVPERPRLGVRLDRVTPLVAEQLGLDANTGVAIAFVSPGSVAEQVGLKVHDIVLAFAGKPVTDDAEDFIRRVNEAKAGEKIDLVVLRKGKKVDVKGVVLADPAR
jgi:hypothetical protein